ncbi:MAG: ABC transporter permease, partial [Amphiamblys sp. WSBS2006]
VSIITQNIFLFNESLLENIRYARIDATDEEVFEASCLACLHEKASSLENQYHTVIGDKGHLLSGGERQRIGLARAFLKKPKILVMDEATSSLDPRTEKKVFENLDRMRREGRMASTLIFITHNMELAASADSIIDLQDKMTLVRYTDSDFE